MCGAGAQGLEWTRRSLRATARDHAPGLVVVTMMKALFRDPRVQAGLAALLGGYLKLALRTIRWRVEGQVHLDETVGRRPVIAAFWHERLPLIPAMWLRVWRASGRRKRAFVLVSRHRDGRFIGEIIRRFHLLPVHGSSGRGGQERGGAAGLRALLARLEEGDHVAITPDGPRGPRRVAALGVAQLAALSGAPIVPCSAQCSPRITLPSWDRMVLPLPFGRGVIVCGAPIEVPGEGAEAALPAIAAALTATVEEADRLCR